VVDYAVGASNPLVGGAHGAGADSITRKTFMNSLAAQSLGNFVPGSILVKEVFTYTNKGPSLEKTLVASGLVAMVKRGGTFNPEHNGWEWFVLKNDASTVDARGADLMGGACNACHQKAASQTGGRDYVFAHPTEVNVASNYFADYQSWDLIEYDESPVNLAGGAHIDDANLRRVFQKQVYANPQDAGAQGYPIGTAIVKDISKDGAIRQRVAMVKRGGNFNKTGGDWEFFILDANDPGQVSKNASGAENRGAIAACVACHADATGDAGRDYVFKHSHAPFNGKNPDEFIATTMSLRNYQAWTLSDYAVGATNPFIASAHNAANAEFSRAIYQNAPSPTGDEFPLGSILVKEVFTTAAGAKVFAENGVLAMVKRGGNFNPDHKGWEWLVLSMDGKITARSANLFGGACNACHAKAQGVNGKDYSFKKPSEKIALLDDFKDYKSWTLVGENTGNSAANASAHATGAIRRTYKKQASVSPYFEAMEYPVGTLVAKEIITNGVVTQVYGMAKRGGNYSPDLGDWQWFTMSPDMSRITEYGPASFCAGCHAKAGNTTLTDASFRGKDFVFYHESDPVPLPAVMK
jgi:hypothetical protein